MLLLLLLSSCFAFSGGSYIGCFNAKWVEDHLYDSWENSSMTVSMCSQYCSERGYTIYALRYGHYCYCLDYILLQDELFERGRKDDECNTPCYGVSETCGGDKAIEIYVKNSFYLGCFSFHPKYLKKTNFIDASSVYTTRKYCSALCVGYPYFGLAQSNKCYCITEVPCWWELEAGTECNLPCLGAEKCGGSAYVALWNYTEDAESTTAGDVFDCYGRSSVVHGETSPWDIKSGDLLPTESPSWFLVELTDGISVLAVILIVLAFIFGVLSVLCAICSFRTYKNRELVMEVRRRMEVKHTHGHETKKEKSTTLEMDTVNAAGSGEKKTVKGSVKYYSLGRCTVDEVESRTGDEYDDVSVKESSDDDSNDDVIGIDSMANARISHVECTSLSGSESLPQQDYPDMTDPCKYNSGRAMLTKQGNNNAPPLYDRKTIRHTSSRNEVIASVDAASSQSEECIENSLAGESSGEVTKESRDLSIGIDKAVEHELYERNLPTAAYEIVIIDPTNLCD